MDSEIVSAEEIGNPVTRRWNSVDSLQDYRRLATENFPGFLITGAGPFAVADFTTMTVELFEHELLANATGKKVQILQPPAPRRVFRTPACMRD